MVVLLDFEFHNCTVSVCTLLHVCMSMCMFVYVHFVIHSCVSVPIVMVTILVMVVIVLVVVIVLQYSSHSLCLYSCLCVGSWQDSTARGSLQ